MLQDCLRQADIATDIVLLYSDVPPAFYEQLAFRALPEGIQKKAGSVFMALCDEDGWLELLASPIEALHQFLLTNRRRRGIAREPD